MIIVLILNVSLVRLGLASESLYQGWSKSLTQESFIRVDLENQLAPINQYRITEPENLSCSHLFEKVLGPNGIVKWAVLVPTSMVSLHYIYEVLNNLSEFEVSDVLVCGVWFDQII